MNHWGFLILIEIEVGERERYVRSKLGMATGNVLSRKRRGGGGDRLGKLRLGYFR